MPRRRSPPHLPEITGSELRRREERTRATPRGDQIPYRETLRIHGPTRDDFEGRPPATDICLRCGGGVNWSPRTGPANRDGTHHFYVCDEIKGGTFIVPTLTVTTGPRNARTDPETGLRYYRWQGRDLPSVTSIRRMAGLPHGLHQWALGQVIDHVIGHAPDIAQRATDTDPAVRALLKRELRAAATAERDLAAALGTAVHDAAATNADLDTVDEQLRPRLRQYRHWLEVSGAEILATEFQTWNLTLGYAGTADLLVRLRDGSVWLIDLKTGKGVYPEYTLQTIAYLRAEFVGQDDTVDEETTALLAVAKGMAVLHLADDGWEFIRFREDEETWDAFVGLLRFATWMASHSDVATVADGRRKGAAA